MNLGDSVHFVCSSRYRYFVGNKMLVHLFPDALLWSERGDPAKMKYFFQHLRSVAEQQCAQSAGQRVRHELAVDFRTLVDWYGAVVQLAHALRLAGRLAPEQQRTITELKSDLHSGINYLRDWLFDRKRYDRKAETRWLMEGGMRHALAVGIAEEAIPRGAPPQERRESIRFLEMREAGASWSAVADEGCRCGKRPHEEFCIDRVEKKVAAAAAVRTRFRKFIPSIHERISHLLANCEAIFR
jgi:hypothetical protein